MFIESTFMRYGHGRAGIVGITLKPETLKTWALSHHICSQLMEDLAELRGESDEYSIKDSHKEEAASRISSDKKDREALKRKLEMCIHPLKPELHPEQLVNVANGTIGISKINYQCSFPTSEASSYCSGQQEAIDRNHCHYINRRSQGARRIQKQSHY